MGDSIRDKVLDVQIRALEEYTDCETSKDCIEFFNKNRVTPCGEHEEAFRNCMQTRRFIKAVTEAQSKFQKEKKV